MSIHSTIINAVDENATAALGELYLTIMDLEAKGVDTGLTRQGLELTGTGKKTHAPAGKGIIISTGSTGKTFILSDVGKVRVCVVGAGGGGGGGG